ncbi:phosphoribosyltransferase family protein [Leucobacter sp. USCH14]|uniref:ComF family protein n=1 Tax=Leucobacter sp. USCH14 TaxID=3024838 RepID=UPI0030958A64
MVSSRLPRLPRLPSLSRLHEVALDLAALVWPTACVACGADDRDCCTDCRARLRELPEMPTRELDGVACLVRGAYAGPLRAVLVAFKHDGRVGFCRLLADELRAPLLQAIRLASTHAHGPSSAPIVVPMPSRPRGERKRGYRHLDQLIAAALRVPRAPALRVRALRTTSGRVGQVGLRASERERNARRIAVRSSVRRLLRGRSVVLVDDIITTGASMRAGREALEQAGANVVAMVALCIAERRDATEDPAKSRMKF